MTLDDRLRHFTVAVLERRGALVDWPAGASDGLALFPAELARQWGVDETVNLVSRLDDNGLWPSFAVNLATDFLERIKPLVEAESRVTAFRGPDVYLKKSAMDEPVSRTFSWPNAKVRVLSAEPARIEYDAWHFLVNLHSENRFEEIIPLTVNSETGAAVELPDLWDWPDLEPLPGLAPLAPSIQYRALVAVGHRVQARVGEFVRNLESRLARDRQRLKDYYGALLRQAAERPERPGTDPAETLKKREARNLAVELELKRKLLELEERYALQAELAPVALVRLELPVLAVEVEVFRKKARAVRVLYWNPLLKILEPLACQECLAPIYTVHFTDGEVKPLCGQCIK